MRQRWRLAQFLELWWWRKYLLGRPPVDYLAWKRNYWQNFLAQSAVTIPDGAAVLDAGCGPAGIFTILDRFQTDAVDPLTGRYAKTLPHFNPSCYPHVRFFAQTIESFSSEKKYDVVFCLNALNHVSDARRCLRNLHTHTRPGGTLLLSVDAHNFRGLKNLFRALPLDLLHPQQHDPPEYEALLTEAGYTIRRRLLLKKNLVFNYYLWVAIAG